MHRFSVILKSRSAAGWHERVRTLLRSTALWFGLFSLAAMAAVAFVVDVPGHSGTDTAAHVYKVDLVRAGESLVWDDFWFSGTYGAAAYGLLYYEVAVIVGEAPLVILAAGLLPLFFWLFVRRTWGVTSLVPAMALLLLVAVNLGSGEYPFFVGLSLMMAGAALLAARHPRTAALPVAAALYVNPLAVLVGGVFLLSDLVTRQEARRSYLGFALVLAPFALVRGLLLLAFRQPSEEINFASTQLRFIGEALGCLVAVRLSGDRRRRLQEVFFGFAAAACLLAWLIPHNPVGQAMGRIVTIFAIPVLLTVRWRRPLVLAVAMIASMCLMFPWSALPSYFAHPRPLSRERVFFEPAVALAEKLADPNYRFHVVPLHDHWESYFFPINGLPLARGWFRQSDALHNGLFYGSYSLATYVAWLRDVGVRYVFVPYAAGLEWSGRPQSRLLATGAQFRLIAKYPHWRVYELLRPQPIVVAAREYGQAAGEGMPPRGATVVSYERDRVVVAVTKPGAYVVKVTHTPLWTLSGGRGSIQRGNGDWVLLTADAPGAYVLKIDGRLGHILKHVL